MKLIFLFAIVTLLTINYITTFRVRLSRIRVPKIRFPRIRFQSLFRRIRIYKSTAYPVCKRPYNEFERDLVTRLTRARNTNALTTYLSNHQKCSAPNGKRDSVAKRGIYEEFPGIAVQYTLVKCYEASHGSASSSTNTYNMCRECRYLITFPDEYTHRYHYHVTCHKGTSTNPDYSCMGGEGTCVKLRVSVPLERRKAGAYKNSNNKNDYEFTDVTFTKSCRCEIIKDSLLAPFALF